jgi:hypothetical protein
MSNYQIKPLEGINDLLFGLSSDLVKQCFGEPEEIEELDAIEDYETTLWHYWEKGITIFFDKKDELVFTSIEIDDQDSELWGQRIFEMNEQAIIKLFQSKGFVELDTEMMPDGEKRVSFDDAMVDLYFEKGELTGVSYGIYLDNEFPSLNLN